MMLDIQNIHIHEYHRIFDNTEDIVFYILDGFDVSASVKLVNINPKVNLPTMMELYVVKKHRNKGLGGILINHCEEKVVKNPILIDKLFLFVNKNNFIAEKYIERGYKYTGDTINDGTQHWMVKNLKR